MVELQPSKLAMRVRSPPPASTGVPEIEIRRVRADEWKALRDVRLAALADSPDAFATTHAEAAGRPDEWWREWARQSAEGADQSMFLAWREREPVGITGAFRKAGRVYVISMWTAPSVRGRGVGRALLDAAVAFAGDSEVRLSVTETNAGAWRFYEAYGFEATGATEPVRPGSALLAHELALRR
jgi:ribosomal protein S18 acetylase RimI-like enzyme